MRLKQEIFAFIALVFLFSCVPYYMMVHTGTMMAGGGIAVRLIMWCPAFAAFACCALFRIDLASLGWTWRPAKWQWLAYLLPIGYALPVYILTWIFIHGSCNVAGFFNARAASFLLPNIPKPILSLIYVFFGATVGVVMSMASALGEEIGWRGFLLPRLVRWVGFTGGCFISGIIWAVWHYPGLLGADYNAGTNPKYALACFTLMVIACAFILGWLRLKSGSLWTGAMLHASHNLFIQAFFDQMTNPVGRARYITTEFGCGLVITVSLCAIYFWRRRGELIIPQFLETSRELRAEA
jgi:uncharacterized protein